MRHLAILNTHPTVVTIDGDIDATDKDGNVVTLDESLITAEIEKLQAQYDNLAYARNRADAYPTIEAQLDSIFHEGVEGWKGTIKAIKDKHPKGTK